MSGAGGAAATLIGAAAAAQELPVSSRELWQMMRLQPVAEPDLNWLDTASAGSSVRGVLIEEYRQREALSRDVGSYLVSQCAGANFSALMQAVAGFMGAQPDEVVLLSGATEALNLVAGGVDLVPGDEILTTTHEHPAAIYPWLLLAKRHGVKVVQVPLPTPILSPQQVLDAFSSAITERTRVMSFAHVQYTDGCVMPVAELCALARSRNILSVVDGAQALGMFPVSVRALGCDFYATSFGKWLNGVAGSGALCLVQGARFRVWPGIVAGHDDWDTVDRFGVADAAASAPFRADWPAAMKKYGHTFHHIAPLHQAVRPALDLQQQLGAERIAARIRELAWYLRMELQRLSGVGVLTSTHPGMWAGIVSFQIPGIDHGPLVAALRSEDHIAVSRVQHAAIGFDAVRAATHIFNDHDDIDRLVGVLRRRLRACGACS